MAEEDNWSRQADEVEALSAIYGDEWTVEDPVDRRYSIKISDGSTPTKYSIQLEVTFSDQYPSNAPPVYNLIAPWMRGDDRKLLDGRMQETYLGNVGECIVFKWIDTVREFLEEKATLDDQLTSSPLHVADSNSPSELPSSPDGLVQIGMSDKEGSDDGEPEVDEYGFDPKLHIYRPPENFHAANVEHKDDIPLPVIHHGQKVTDRKSVFMGHLAAVTHKQQVDMVLNSLKENKKIAEATHNIIAYRIDGGNGVWITGCADDGEIHAGSRMLHLLDIMDARNVMVVVTRWYGGIHLGPDRFKHINNCTRDLLEEHGYIKDKSDKKGPKTSSAAQQGKKKKR